MRYGFVVLTTNIRSLRFPFRPAQVVALTRATAGAGAWLAPDTTWRLVGLGPLPDRGSTATVTRLFGVRDLALAWAVAQPDARLRRTALATGVVIDSVDAVAGVLGARGGAPRASILGVSVGAAALALLGVVAFAESERP